MTSSMDFSDLLMRHLHEIHLQWPIVSYTGESILFQSNRRVVGINSSNTIEAVIRPLICSELISFVVLLIVHLLLMLFFEPIEQNLQPQIFNTLYQLLQPIDITYNATVSTLKHYLSPPFVFCQNEAKLRQVVMHYLQYFDCETRSTPSPDRNYCVIIVKDDNNQKWPLQQFWLKGQRYFLTFMEKALLMVMTCFVGDFFQGLRPGKSRSCNS